MQPFSTHGISFPVFSFILNNILPALKCLQESCHLRLYNKFYSATWKQTQYIIWHLVKKSAVPFGIHPELCFSVPLSLLSYFRAVPKTAVWAWLHTTSLWHTTSKTERGKKKATLSTSNELQAFWRARTNTLFKLDAYRLDIHVRVLQMLHKDVSKASLDTP